MIRIFMIGNIFRIIIALIVGYLVGLLSGYILGILLGLIPGLFFREIANANQTILMSIILSITLGGLLGFSAIQIGNKLFEDDDKPLNGALAGAIIGFIVVCFIGGVIDVPNPDPYRFNYIAPVIYGGVIGCYIGTIIIPIFNVARVIREIVKSYKEARNYENRVNESKKEPWMTKNRISKDQ